MRAPCRAFSYMIPGAPAGRQGAESRSVAHRLAGAVEASQWLATGDTWGPDLERGLPAGAPVRYRMAPALPSLLWQPIEQSEVMMAVGPPSVVNSLAVGSMAELDHPALSTVS